MGMGNYKEFEMKRNLIAGFLMFVLSLIFVSVAFCQSAKAGETWLITYRITLSGDVVEQDSLVITFTSNSSDIKAEAAKRLGYSFLQSGGYWLTVQRPAPNRAYKRLFILSTVKL